MNGTKVKGRHKAVLSCFINSCRQYEVIIDRKRQAILRKDLAGQTLLENDLGSTKIGLDALTTYFIV